MKYFHIILSFVTLSCSSPIEYPQKGFDYPSNINTADVNNYIFPLRDSFSSKDSFEFSNNYRHSFVALDEPNLSIKALEKPVYRLYYASGMDRPVVISLTENLIEIKEGVKGYGTPYYDTSKLEKLEKFHFQLLQDFFPIHETKLKMYTLYFDSLINIYPKLLSTTYYQFLLDKSLSFGNDSFQYSVKTIPITEKTFTKLVNGINLSDYWEQPFHTTCKNPPSDGFVFTLEANTPQKYKFVEIGFCPGRTTQKFQSAWEELIKICKLEKRISLVWNEEN